MCAEEWTRKASAGIGETTEDFYPLGQFRRALDGGGKGKDSPPKSNAARKRSSSRTHIVRNYQPINYANEVTENLTDKGKAGAIQRRKAKGP